MVKSHFKLKTSFYDRKKIDNKDYRNVITGFAFCNPEESDKPFEEFISDKVDALKSKISNAKQTLKNLDFDDKDDKKRREQYINGLEEELKRKKQILEAVEELTHNDIVEDDENEEVEENDDDDNNDVFDFSMF